MGLFTATLFLPFSLSFFFLLKRAWISRLFPSFFSVVFGGWIPMKGLFFLLLSYSLSKRSIFTVAKNRSFLVKRNKQNSLEFFLPLFTRLRRWRLHLRFFFGRHCCCVYCPPSTMEWWWGTSTRYAASIGAFHKDDGVTSLTCLFPASLLFFFLLSDSSLIL